MALFSVTLGDSTFCISFLITVVGGDRDFNFGRSVDHCKCWSVDDKLSLKGAWSGHVNHLNFGGHQSYLQNGYSYSDQILHTGRLYDDPAY